MAPCKKQQPPAKQTEPTSVMKMKSVANKGNLEPKKKIKKKTKVASETEEASPEPIAAEEELETPSVTLTTKDLGEFLEIEFEEGEYRKPTDFNWDNAWQLVSGTSELYKSPSPISKLMNAEMRLLHMVVGNILDCREGSLTVVTQEDLWIMHLALSGAKFNTAMYLICRFRQIAKNKKYPPAYGNVVTEFFKESEFWNERFEQNSRRVNLVPINSTSLTRMQYEQEGPTTWKKKDYEAETSTTRENSESLDSKIQKYIREMVYGPLRFLQEKMLQSLTEQVESLTEEVACLQRKVSGNRDAATGAENGKENEAEEDRNEEASENPVPSLAMMVYKAPTEEKIAAAIPKRPRTPLPEAPKLNTQLPAFTQEPKSPNLKLAKK
ncbi:hypothetical protein COLO4_31705 [Corchorus olitorius]|uniref:Uncharacterized protein n=1 Tax=Corchorus olitorius TaxID=93759 RepID=A0A1R3H3H0_9ROSI|nr:hypothetical protein COLO4_31705 [Corchorus olitorius]